MWKIRIAISVAAVCVFSAITFSALADTNDAGLSRELFQAIRNNDAAMTGKLLQRGAGVNAKDEDGATPLMQAALYGDAGLMKLLLDKGADPKARNKTGATALLWAVHDLNQVKLLVQKGAEVNARSASGKLPLLLACYYSKSAETVKFLLDSGADIHAKDARGASALLFAAEGGDLNTVKLLLDKGLDVNEGTTNGFPEIRFSIFVAPTGANAIKGYTALMVAAIANDPEEVKLLLARGANVNAKATDGMTPLLATGYRGSFGLVQPLIEKGAQVNVQDKDGRTPLMLMAAGDYTPAETIKLLLQKGADVNAKGKDGMDALAWAKQRGDTAIVKALRAAGAKDGAAPPMASTGMAAGRPGNYKLREAVEKGLAPLQKAGPEVVKQRACITCHNQSIPALAVAMARERGFVVNEAVAQREVKSTIAVLGSHREDLLQHIASIPLVPEVAGYGLVGIGAEKYAADRYTDAIVHDIAQKQRRDGSWLSGDGRPPLEESDFSITAVSVRSLQLYPVAGRRAEFEQRIAAARGWLQATKAVTNEDRTFKVIGLVWAKGDTKEAVRDLLAHQKPSGGWAGLETIGEDAYATGQALAALQMAGVAVTGGEYQKGVKYLLSTQLADGSWHVKTRAVGFQPYLESGFPHGHDQWISSAGTAWSVYALAATEPVKRAAR